MTVNFAHRRLGLAALPFAFAAIACASLASADVPEDFAGVPNLRAVEPIAGLEAWVSNVHEMVWMKDPETGHRFVGYVFDAEGRSVNPAYAEAGELTLAAFIQAHFPPDSIRIPAPMVPDVEARMKELSEADREAAIRALIETVRDVKDEAAFNAAVADWLQVIDRMISEAKAKTTATEEAAVAPAPEPAAEADPAAPEPEPEPEPSVVPDAK